MLRRRLLIACVLLAACSKHEVSDLTPWLRVDVQRPKSDSGIIRIGSSQESWEVKIDGRWQTLGRGNGGGYVILGEEALTANAAVVYLGHGDPLLVRPDASPQPLQGAVSYPTGMTIDVLHNTDHDANIVRYDATGKQIGTFSASVPSEYSDCRTTAIRGYAGGIPYVDTVCSNSSPQARCLVITADKQQVVHVVKPDEPRTDCDFVQLHLSKPQSLYRQLE